jgi:biotin carboxylase
VKRVLLLATTTGYQIRSFGDAAQKLGVRLVFASDRCDQLEDPWWDQAVPVRFHDEAASLTAIRSSLDRPPDGIVAVGDRPVTLAAFAAASYGLPGNLPAAASATRNKLAARAAFQAGGLLTPPFFTLGAADDPAAIARTVGYPAVVKPMALSGSRGVIRVDDESACVAAIARVRQLLRSPDVLADQDSSHERILIEQFIPGREFAVEGLLTAGAFRVLAIFDKPDPMDGPFFEETIYVTPSRQPDDVTQQITATMARAVEALGLRHGPVHGECRVNEHGVYVLEVAARPIGGLCSKALRFAASDGGAVSLEELLLRHALGEDVAAYPREAAASGVMMIPIPRRGVLRGVDGVDAAKAVPGITDVRITAKIDSLLVPLPEGRSYLGFIFATAGAAAGVEQALRAAHSRLRFDVQREVFLAGRR